MLFLVQCCSMQTHSATHSHTTSARQNYSYKDFIIRLGKNSKHESIVALRQLYFLYRVIVVTIGGFLFFIFGFSLMKEIFKAVSRILFIYITVVYLTLLPTYVFFFLVLLPMKWTGRILGIAVFYAFFSTFLI